MKNFFLMTILMVGVGFFTGCTVTRKEISSPATPAPANLQSTSPGATIMPVENGAATNVQSSTGKKTYTLDDIAPHKTKNDCWMSIEGKVYDVSPYTSQDKHPAGAVILKGCGTDATQLYNNLRNERGTHSQNARAMLEEYLIGDLEQ